MAEEEDKKEVIGLNEATDDIKMAVQDKMKILDKGLINLSISNRKEYVNISIVPPDTIENVCLDLVCVIDISGSMDTEAQLKNNSGNKEGNGLSYLDLLKHAIKTLILTLNEKDRLALISYSDNARVEFPFHFMNDENK